METASPSAQTLHDHLQSHTALSSLENGLNKWLLIGGVAAAAVVLAPVALPYLGIGGGVAAALSEECCTIVGVETGIAGGVMNLVENIPVIGTYLSTAGGENILVPAVTILGGQAAGALVTNYEKAHGGSGSIGAFVRVTSLAVGVVLALPAVLPGIGHGVQMLSRLIGADEFGKAVAIFLGNTSSCTSVATTNGIMGGASTLAAHIPCMIPAIATSFPLLAPALSQSAAEKTLPADDANHGITPEQKSWVEAYNKTPEELKPGMQKWFREKGFDPDFHEDGSMHLHKHTPGMSR